MLRSVATGVDCDSLSISKAHNYISTNVGLSMAELNSVMEYASGKMLMKHESAALHDHLSVRMETAIGSSLPQMEVRFKNLSAIAKVAVSDSKNEDMLPMLSNTLLQLARGMLPMSKRTETRHILKKVSGAFKPGTMTLVLGQPGSGKSSLMKILSDCFPLTSSTVVEGEISYNGADHRDVARRVPQFASYIPQRDLIR